MRGVHGSVDGRFRGLLVRRINREHDDGWKCPDHGDIRELYCDDVVPRWVPTIQPCSAYSTQRIYINKAVNGWYRILLSLFARNFPRILIPMTLNGVSASISKIVKTASYKIEFPTFFELSVFVATCAKISLICSLVPASPIPKVRNSLKILTCKNGSAIPVTSCSGSYPAFANVLSVLTNTGT